MFKSIDSLENLINFIPIFKEAVPTDLSIAICDLEKFIAYFPGETIHLNISRGQALNPEEPLMFELLMDRVHNIKESNKIPYIKSISFLLYVKGKKMLLIVLLHTISSL